MTDRETQSIEDLVEEATLEFTLGNTELALARIDSALEFDPGNFSAWLARAEFLFAQKDYEKARTAAEQGLAINPDDVHVHTSLSRIWMELGDKARAEEHGARARTLGWKQQLQNSKPTS